MSTNDGSDPNDLAATYPDEVYNTIDLMSLCIRGYTDTLTVRDWRESSTIASEIADRFPQPLDRDDLVRKLSVLIYQTRITVEMEYEFQKFSSFATEPRPVSMWVNKSRILTEALARMQESQLKVAALYPEGTERYIAMSATAPVVQSIRETFAAWFTSLSQQTTS